MLLFPDLEHYHPLEHQTSTPESIHTLNDTSSVPSNINTQDDFLEGPLPPAQNSRFNSVTFARQYPTKSRAPDQLTSASFRANPETG